MSSHRIQWALIELIPFTVVVVASYKASGPSLLIPAATAVYGLLNWIEGRTEARS